MNENNQIQKPKSIRWLIVLIVLPILLLITVMIMEIFVQFAQNKVSAQSDFNTTNTSETIEVDSEPVPTLYSSPGNDDLITTNNSLTNSNISEDQSTFVIVLRIVQAVLGLSAVIFLMLEPLWIILLILRLNHNNQINQQL